ncbi:PPOX class F420-dependent oxidoreductase [Nonomuraea jabiensis]|uniref:PPOX class F420-dependent oxidoreductase n=1 Tax=Nonomuraea jabiensis TaxID=882448 RepID=UPI003D731B4B
MATVGADGMPHVVPVGWSLDETGTLIEIGGRNLARSRKFRDVARNGRAALVIDDVLPPWRPRGVEIRGRARAAARWSAEPQQFGELGCASRVIAAVTAVRPGTRRGGRSPRARRPRCRG